MLLMFKECPFYRASESLSMGRGVGYCDLDCDRATCEGDQHLCEKPDALKKYLSEQKKREKESLTIQEPTESEVWMIPLIG